MQEPKEFTVTCPKFEGKAISIQKCQACAFHGGVNFKMAVRQLFGDGKLFQVRPNDRPLNNAMLALYEAGKAEMIQYPDSVTCNHPIDRAVSAIWGDAEDSKPNEIVKIMRAKNVALEERIKEIKDAI